MGILDWLTGKKSKAETSQQTMPSTSSGNALSSQETMALDLKTTKTLSADCMNLLERVNSEQTLIASSRGLQLEALAGLIRDAMKQGTIPQAEVRVVTGEEPESWARNLMSVRQAIQQDHRLRRIILAQGVRPPFDDLFTLSGGEYRATVIRTDLTGYQRLVQTYRMVNSEGKANGSFHGLVPVTQTDINSDEEQRLSEVQNGPEAIRELLKISHRIDDYLTKIWPKELAKRSSSGIKQLEAQMRRMDFMRDRKTFDKFVDATATAIMWEEGCKYWVRRDSTGKYISHDACDRDGIALPNTGFADVNLDIMIAVKHGAGTPELADIMAKIRSDES